MHAFSSMLAKTRLYVKKEKKGDICLSLFIYYSSALSLISDSLLVLTYFNKVSTILSDENLIGFDTSIADVISEYVPELRGMNSVPRILVKRNRLKILWVHRILTTSKH